MNSDYQPEVTFLGYLPSSSSGRLEVMRWGHQQVGIIKSMTIKLILFKGYMSFFSPQILKMRAVKSHVQSLYSEISSVYTYLIIT